MGKIRFLYAESGDDLEKVLRSTRSAVVNGHYKSWHGWSPGAGESYVAGSVVTLGPTEENAAAFESRRDEEGYLDSLFLRPNQPADVEVVATCGISLSTLAGCLVLLGRKPEHPSFWRYMNFRWRDRDVRDLRDPHPRWRTGAKMSGWNDHETLQKMLAWGEVNALKVKSHSRGVHDVTDWFERALEQFETIVRESAQNQ